MAFSKDSTQPAPLSRDLHVERLILERATLEACIVLIRNPVHESAMDQAAESAAQSERVAYVVPKIPFSAERMVRRLSLSLSDQQMPHAVVTVNNLPLLSNGEVDTAALAALPVWDAFLVDQVTGLLNERDGVTACAAAPGPASVEDAVQTRPLLGDALSDALFQIAEGTDIRANRISDDGDKERPPAIADGGPLEDGSDRPANLLDALKRAGESGNGFRFIDAAGQRKDISYAEMYRQAGSIAAGLAETGVQPGDMVIIQSEDGPSFMQSLWGSLWLGAVPVPLTVAASYKQSNHAVAKLINAWRMLDHPPILCDGGLLHAIKGVAQMESLSGWHVHEIGAWLSLDPAPRHQPQGDETALLFLSSGSTGLPKAVTQTHKSLLAMSAGTYCMNDFTVQDTTLNWMPFDHVGAVAFLSIMPIDLGATQVHAPTAYVLQNPLRWLTLIEEHRAAISWAPNFAFSLIDDLADKIREANPDLSSMRFIVNAGEAVAAVTVRRFMKLLQEHGMPHDAMRPAFGMSETCSGITWSEGLTLENSSDNDRFVSLGPIIPGAAMRVTDDHNRLLKEGDIGRVQFKGLSVTKGYHANEERNRESFTADGWFNTGDLGFIRESHLYITGREKDEIIINGANFYCHEIETAAEEVDGVETSFTAACAVTLPGFREDRLALFYHPDSWSTYDLRVLRKRLRGALTRHIGVNADYFIPLKKKDIPKTGIGKIQRAQLKKQFEEGRFDKLLQEQGCPPWSARLTPSWYTERVWRQRLGEDLATFNPNRKPLLWLPIERLADRLTTAFEGATILRAGTEYAVDEAGNYTVDPADDRHLERALTDLGQHNTRPDHIVYAAALGDPDPWTDGTEKARVEAEVAPLLHMVRALAKTHDGFTRIRLIIATCGAQNVFTGEIADPARAALYGIAKTISREWDWIDTVIVDIDDHTDFAMLNREMHLAPEFDEVALRRGDRYIPRLLPIQPKPATAETTPTQGGFYVITGGLGVVGNSVARLLLSVFNAKLLLVGRTPAAQLNAEVQDRFSELQRLSDHLVYETADVCEQHHLEKIIAHWETKWDTKLNGMFHLAGDYREQMLVDEDAATVAELWSVRVLGARTCHRLLASRGGGRLINFSTVAGLHGSVTSGAYSASCSALDRFVSMDGENQRVSVTNLSWSYWEENGLPSEFAPGVLDANGYSTVTRGMAYASLLIALNQDLPQLWIGLNSAYPRIRCKLETPVRTVDNYHAFVTLDADVQMEPLEVTDRYDTTVNLQPEVIREMPRGVDGDIELNALKDPEHRTSAATGARLGEVEQRIAGIWKQALGIDSVGLEDNFFELGGHSLSLIQVHSRLKDAFEREITLVEMFQYPTIAALTELLDRDDEENKAVTQGQNRADRRGRGAESNNADKIAVIGMACRFPGADNPETFAENLRNGVESIRELSREELEAAGVDPASCRQADYVTACPYLDDIDRFDAEFFGYSAREAELLDPQQRLMLEVAWETMEHAGYAPGDDHGSVGVYAGCGTNTYLINHVTPNRFKLDSNDDLFAVTLDSFGGFQLMVANDKDYLTTRLSYKLNLTGPSINIQTACSTTLVAIHMASQSLISGECDMVLAGGSSINTPQTGHLFQEGMIVTPDGHCRAFDARAEGTIFGSGVGMVLLKRLDEAQRDGDHIHAVIMGTACNNDGGVKVGYMAPSGDGQASTVSEAIQVSGVDPETITYMEAHGTGTPIGDPIEINGLGQAFKQVTDRNGFCAIGSVKTNIGHMQISSGIAGFMKTVLCLKHRMLPANLHFERPNPGIDFDDSPFQVCREFQEWNPTNADGETIPRRAGVNSLGIGGTNAHVIMEEAPVTEARDSEGDRSHHLFTLSARNNAALLDYAAKFSAWLTENPDVPLGDICFTVNQGRPPMAHRLALGVTDNAQLKAKLNQFINGEGGIIGQELDGSPRIAWLFSGQGSQYGGMGADLYQTCPAFREAVNDCAELLAPHFEKPLAQFMFDETALRDTLYAQPALFALSYGLGRFWQSLGVKPNLLIGHSVGEFAAACLAGVFSLDDAVTMVAARAKAMQDTAPGSMAAVFCEETVVAELIENQRETLAIAAVNGPRNIVVSGARPAVEALCAQLREQGIKSKDLGVNRAFHSPLTAPALETFAAVARRVTYHTPQFEILTNMSGDSGAEELTRPEYWIQHIIHTVRYADCVQVMAERKPHLVMEIGPQATLISMARNGWEGEEPLWGPNLRKGKPDWDSLLQCLGQAYSLGVAINWSALDRDRPRRRTPLPTYPFQRHRYWIDMPHRANAGSGFVKTQNERSPMLGDLTRSPMLDMALFQADWRLADIPNLRDHLVDKRVVVPGAVYIGLFLEAAREVYPGAAFQLEEVLLPKPMILEDNHSYGIQLGVDTSGDRRFSLLSLMPDADQADDAAWSTHLQGRFDTVHGRSVEPLDVSGLKANFTQRLSSDEAHDIVVHRGIEVGPTFRCIQRLYRKDGEVLAEVLPPSPATTPNWLAPHAALDSALQTLLTALPDAPGQTLVPFRIAAMTAHQPFNRRMWVHTKIRESDPNRKSAVVCDIQIYDENGAWLAEISGFEARRVNRADLNDLAATFRWDWLYNLEWYVMTPPVKPCPSTRHWLILADRTGLGERVADFLHHDNQRCTLVYREQSEGGGSDDHFYGNVESVMNLWDRLSAEGVPPNGMVYLWSDEMGSDPASCAFENSRAFHGLMQGVLNRESPPRDVFWVTHDAFEVASGDQCEGYAQAVLQGAADSLHQEQPDMSQVCLDFCDWDGEDVAAALAVELARPTSETRIAYRRGGGARLTRYVPRLTPMHPFKHTPQSVEISTDTAYVITGGMRGLGWETANWLVDAGARHLILIGRGAPDDTVWNQLEEWRRQGIDARVLRADISLAESVIQIEAALDEKGLDLGGVIHAAGVLEDGALLNMDWESFNHVLEPKIAGAVHLSQIIEKRRPKLVLYFSSIASALGSAGQTNYSAANAFLDHLAARQNAMGLTAQSVNWGPWLETGMAKNRDLIQDLKRYGLDAIPTDMGLRLMSHITAHPDNHVMVAAINWDMWLMNTRPVPMLNLLKSKEPLAVATTTATAFDWEKSDVEERRGLLYKHVEEIVANVLGIQPGDLEPDKGFFDQGLDSLATVELRGRLQKSLDTRLSQTLAFDYPTLESLVDFLADHLFGAEETLEITAAAPVITEPETTITDYDALSDEEAENLLDERLDLIEDLLEAE